MCVLRWSVVVLAQQQLDQWVELLAASCELSTVMNAAVYWHPQDKPSVYWECVSAFTSSSAGMCVTVYSGRPAAEEIRLVSIGTKWSRVQMFPLIKICGLCRSLDPPSSSSEPNDGNNSHCLKLSGKPAGCITVSLSLTLTQQEAHKSLESTMNYYPPSPFLKHTLFSALASFDLLVFLLRTNLHQH